MQTIQESAESIFHAEADVAFVATWDDAEGVTYIQGYSGNDEYHGSRVFNHCAYFGIPMPYGDWTVYHRDGTISIMEN